MALSVSISACSASQIAENYSLTRNDDGSITYHVPTKRIVKDGPPPTVGVPGTKNSEYCTVNSPLTFAGPRGTDDLVLGKICTFFEERVTNADGPLHPAKLVIINHSSTSQIQTKSIDQNKEVNNRIAYQQFLYVMGGFPNQILSEFPMDGSYTHRECAHVASLAGTPEVYKDVQDQNLLAEADDQGMINITIYRPDDSCWLF